MIQMMHCRKRRSVVLCSVSLLAFFCGVYLTHSVLTRIELPSSRDLAETLAVRHLLNTLTQNYSVGQEPQSSLPSSSSPSSSPSSSFLSQTHTETHTSYIKLEGVDSIGHDLFVVYAASIEQLKMVCTALPDCEGFNSDGWVKSRVSNKKRADMELYMKQTAVVDVAVNSEFEDQLSPYDHSAGAFLKHLDDYDAMEKELRIYMYETNIGMDMPSYQDYKYGVEFLFLTLLSKSTFRTMDPEEATFFFLPSRCTAYRKSTEDLSEGIQVAADTTGQMIEEVKQKYPYWNRTLGADHFYICAHDMGTAVTKSAQADPHLLKNAIGLVNTADYLEPTFVPHKDISLPPHSGRGTVDWALIGQGGATFDPSFRTRLAFMAGHPGRGPVRPKIYELFSSDPDFLLIQGYSPDKEYMNALKTSKFCLCPRGNAAWSPRLMDALWFGCIPVFIADHYTPPLLDVIQWDSVSVTIPEKQVPDLKRILSSINEQKIRKMQQSIESVYKHLTWNDPPQPYDAFHSVLFELWQKRHTRRIRQWTLPQDSISYPLL